jgi:hypothetical protein
MFRRVANLDPCRATTTAAGTMAPARRTATRTTTAIATVATTTATRTARVTITLEAATAATRDRCAGSMGERTFTGVAGMEMEMRRLGMRLNMCVTRPTTRARSTARAGRRHGPVRQHELVQRHGSTARARSMATALMLVNETFDFVIRPIFQHDTLC